MVNPPEGRRKRRGKTRRGSFLDNLPPEERLREMARQYQENQAEDIRATEARTRDGLRRRRDGSPSARPPVGQVPVSLWATVLDAPDGGDDWSSRSALGRYQTWLRLWKEKGIYDGPTDLKVVNREE